MHKSFRADRTLHLDASGRLYKPLDDEAQFLIQRGHHVTPSMAEKHGLYRDAEGCVKQRPIIAVGLSYPAIQACAKALGLKAGGKREDLIAAIEAATKEKGVVE